MLKHMLCQNSNGRITEGLNMNKNIWRVFGIKVSIALIFSAANIACQNNENVTYEVTGDAESVEIMVTNDNGGTGQYNDVHLP
jgi:hypothetical protein